MKQKSPIVEAYFVAICALVVLVSVTYSSSYAFFEATIETIGENNDATITTKELKNVVISDGTDISSSSNMIPGDSVYTTFTVNNPNDIKTYYSLAWSNIANTFVHYNDLKYTLTLKDSSGATVTDVVFPQTGSEDNIVSNVEILAGATHEYTLTVTYHDEDYNQIDDEEAAFSGTIILK